MNILIDVAVGAGLIAVGNIFFGHFEERTAKWRRVLKLVLFTGAIGWIASVGGHLWAAAFMLASGCFGASAHFIILRRHGINPWTAEPRDKYYALRGWRT